MGRDSFGASYCGAYGSNPDYSYKIRDACSDIEAIVITLGAYL